MENSTSNETTERDAFFAWFAEKGSEAASYNAAQDAFVAGFQAARASLAPPSAEPVVAEKGVAAHEEIIREGDNFVCTACGTTTAAASPPIQVAPSEPVMGYVNLETLDFAVAFYQNKVPEGYLPIYLAPVPQVAPTNSGSSRPAEECESNQPLIARTGAFDQQASSGPPQVAPEQNFCARCGKLNIGIHTCTPPGEEVAQERAYTDSYTVSQFANSENSRIAPEQASVRDARRAALEEVKQIVDCQLESHRPTAADNNGRASDIAFGRTACAEELGDAIRALISKEAAPEDVQLGKFSDMPAVNARPAPDVIQCFAAPCADSDVDQTRQLWQEAISQAAFYVLNHCQDGGHHAEAIMSMPLPAMQPTTGKEPT